MKVHHINCATLCPASARLVNGRGGLFEAGRMVCHCLLVESDDGLVLVDTGLGAADVENARTRLGQAFLLSTRPRLDLEETALRQVERLGFRRSDVRHVIPTHLDLDHAGGLSDFPDATVHVHAPEHAAAMARATSLEKARYREAQWAHGPRWATHAVEGEKWLGFEAVRAISRSCDVLLVPLIGHTRGHAGVAVKSGDRWLLHAGDAYFNQAEMDPVRPSCPPALGLFQHVVAVLGGARVANRERLRGLAKGHEDEVELFCAHDPETFERLAHPGGAS